MRIIDITRPLGPGTAPWPGDIPFSLSWRWSLSGGKPVNLSSISSSPHVGTHVDAPLHVREGAAPIDAVPLDPFIGPARVVPVAVGRDHLIGPEALRGIDPADPPRILFQTGTHSDSARWDPHFAALAPETADLMVRAGTLLVGLDTPGVDVSDSEDLPTHRRLADGGLYWIENLDLNGVEPGVYDLIALPLPIVGGDASPVRAVLITK